MRPRWIPLLPPCTPVYRRCLTAMLSRLASSMFQWTDRLLWFKGHDWEHMSYAVFNAYVNCITNHLDNKGACIKTAGHLTFAATQLCDDVKVAMARSKFSTVHKKNLILRIAARTFTNAANAAERVVCAVRVVAHTVVTKITPIIQEAVRSCAWTSLPCIRKSQRVHRDTRNCKDESNNTLHEPIPEPTRNSSSPAGNGILECSLHEHPATSGPQFPDVAGDGPVC